MVPLENKMSYIEKINEIPKLKAFHCLLLEKTAILPSDNLSDADELFYDIVSSIQSNNKEAFEQIYNKKSKSNPSKDSLSPFVNDDFLIFCLIVGINKFDIDKNWIKNIISIRSRNAITITLESILNENYYSKSNFPEIVLVFFHLNNLPLIINDFLTTTFRNISENTSLFESKSDFHILCAIRAYELIIELKEAPDTELLKKFQDNFLKRIKIIASIIQTITIMSLLFGLIKLFSYMPSIKNLFDNVGTILGIFGVSILSNLIPQMKKILYNVLLQTFGYPKELIEK
jgi:hypothetical protein